MDLKQLLILTEIILVSELVNYCIAFVHHASAWIAAVQVIQNYVLGITYSTEIVFYVWKTTLRNVVLQEMVKEIE